MSDPKRSDHDEFVALLARYELRDGHDPGQPFRNRFDGYVSCGWHVILKELIEDLLKLGWDREVLQVKEKFGSLRFYTRQRNDEIIERVEAARAHSEEVCERCGKGGSLRVGPAGWYATRCDACWALDPGARP